jgi:hypothetical protein
VGREAQVSVSFGWGRIIVTDLVKALSELANNQGGLLVLTGLILLATGIWGKVEGKINLSKTGRVVSILTGALLLAIGLLLPQLGKSVVQNPELPPKASSQVQSIGWIRLGAVRNTSGSASTGEALVATSQPVTITPTLVPAVNDQVVVITGVNVRVDYPKPPDYKLQEKVSVLTSNQKIVILEIKTFVDQNSSSSYPIVWARVAAP